MALLLMTALRHRIAEPNIEAGFQRFEAVAEQSVDYQAFCDAVADCLRQHLIHEPIRLPEGALQCHWHLELTPKVSRWRVSFRCEPHERQGYTNGVSKPAPADDRPG